MAARTASVSGLWSNTATWGGSAVPISGDSVTINTGITVTFDVSQSAFASGIAGIAINGTGILKFITDGTVTYLKLSGSITGTGSFFVGNSDIDPIPAPAGATPEVATIGINGAFAINNTGTIEFHGELRQPAYPIASKTDGTHIVLSAATPLTWLRTGDVIAISDSTVIGNHSPTSETYTVSSYDASTGTITLGSSLSRSVNQNSVTDYVVLISRNILVTNVASAANVCNSTNTAILFKGTRFSGFSAGFVFGGAGAGGEVDYCEIDTTFACAGVSTMVSVVINFSVLFNCGGDFLINTNGGVVSDCYHLNSVALTHSSSVGIFRNDFIRCVVLNSTNGLFTNGTAGSYFTDCTVYNSGNGCGPGVGNKVNNCIFKHCTNDSERALGQFFNCLFADAVEFTFSAIISPFLQTESFDHDQVTGAYKNLSRGGAVASDTGTVFDASRVRSYKHSPTSTTFYTFMQRSVEVPEGASLYVRCYVQKDASMAYLPRLWVFDAKKEPFLTGTPDSEIIMTNSTSTWEILETTVTNTTNTPKNYIVRTLAKNASGNVYFDPIIRLSSYQPNPAMVGGMVA